LDGVLKNSIKPLRLIQEMRNECMNDASYIGGSN
jgi:hypothetical protein